MSKKDPRVDEYISQAANFARPILKYLRALVHQGCPEVEETLKWGMPHFTYKGILCSIAAFKGHCVFGFWNGDLIFQDEPATKKAQEAMGHFGRITTFADLPSEPVLLDYIREAARLNDKGVKPPARSKPRLKQPLMIPEYVTSALKTNRQARDTFEHFSYSHKKEYLDWFAEAKREETRNRRLQTALEWMAGGKPRNWRYRSC